MSVLFTLPGPDLRLLVSLAAWTWPGTEPNDREVAHILITHSPPVTVPDTAGVTESRMRRLAGSLGQLGGARDAVADAGRCLQIIGGQVLLHFPGASRRLRMTARPDWTALVTRTGEAALLLGLAPLAQSACRPGRRLPEHRTRGRPAAVRTRPHPLTCPLGTSRTAPGWTDERELQWKPSNAPGWTPTSPGSPPSSPRMSRPPRS